MATQHSRLRLLEIVARLRKQGVADPVAELTREISRARCSPAEPGDGIVIVRPYGEKIVSGKRAEWLANPKLDMAASTIMAPGPNSQPAWVNGRPELLPVWHPCVVEIDRAEVDRIWPPRPRAAMQLDYAKCGIAEAYPDGVPADERTKDVINKVRAQLANRGERRRISDKTITRARAKVS
jgi:hypothetical protein